MFRTGYKERWKEFFALLDINNDGFIEPNDALKSPQVFQKYNNNNNNIYIYTKIITKEN